MIPYKCSGNSDMDMLLARSRKKQAHIEISPQKSVLTFNAVIIVNLLFRNRNQFRKQRAESIFRWTADPHGLLLSRTSHDILAINPRAMS